MHSRDGGRHGRKDRIAIVQQILGRRILRKGVPKLLCGPGRGRMRCDGHVNDPSTVVPEDDEYEQQLECDGRHDEQVSGYDLARVVREECSPGL